MKELAMLILSCAFAFAAETTLKVDGMTCPMCVKTIKGALKGIKGVKDASVSLKEGKAVVTHEDSVKAEQLVEAVKKEGYGASLMK